ncbi:hypothetical protein B0H13DRAFT_2355116 [Mycena leptocephala]|nr:hypothetical protein B0H13DRAFT_2355116 [Mycena leptocephala]
MPSNSSPKATATTSSTTSSANLCLRTSSPATSACSPHRTLLSYVILLPSSRPIPLHIHVRFDCLMTLTSLSHPSPPRSWIYLSASRSHIIHWGSCTEPQTSFSFPRAPATLEAGRPLRACFLRSRGGRFWAQDTSRSLPSPPSLLLPGCAYCRASVSPCSCTSGGAAGRIHAYEAAVDATSSALGILRAHLARLVRLATVVDGDGEARRWGWDDNTDDDCTRARTSSPSSSRLTLWFGAATGTVEAGTYPPPLSARYRPAFPIAPTADAGVDLAW